MDNKDIAFCVIQHLTTLDDIRNFRLVCKSFFKASKNLYNMWNSRENYGIEYEEEIQAIGDTFSYSKKYGSFSETYKKYLSEQKKYGAYGDFWVSNIHKELIFNGKKEKVIIHPIKETIDRTSSVYLYYGLKKWSNEDRFNIYLTRRPQNLERCSYCARRVLYSRPVGFYIEDLDFIIHSVFTICYSSLSSLKRNFHATKSVSVKQRLNKPIMKNEI